MQKTEKTVKETFDTKEDANKRFVEIAEQGLSANEVVHRYPSDDGKIILEYTPRPLG